MLGRTAHDLYWLSRYIERAENMARLIDVGYRIGLTPRSGPGRSDEWRSTLKSTGCEAGYFAKHDDIDVSRIIDFLLFDADNPSSVRSCLATARHNGRAQRTAMTSEMWESLNQTWLDYSRIDPRSISIGGLPDLLLWIKQRSALFRGTLLNTVLRRDGYFFSQLGTFLERSDNTARILDVKYYLLLPQNEIVGGGIDSYHWSAILRSVSAHRSYRWVYKESYKPWRIAEYLILNGEMPRSLRYCADEINATLDALGVSYATTNGCHDLAHANRKLLVERDIATIIQSGLHEFLLDFVARNNRLGEEIARSYHFTD